ncbi:hypothetical protein ONE63_001684 [Megalurothrips usitatus]|uniref:Peptidase S1 domain-containing protein n=1 Tax=Megalurothrips usitatus TaxID=439358 RepID=A0AAV7XFZ3_9NEOP|nr:hypothetical protein ONE63_001684 [Megalurothrips usitatus]
MSRPALPGTVAKFRCRPLHEFLFGYLPAAGFESRCSSAGDWSVQPFRCVPICGQPTGRGVEFIRNGNMSTSAADFPWHVTVYDKATPKNVKQICGGTLISTKYFVSAAHCFHNGKTAFPASRYVAGFGKVKRSANDTEPTEQFRETSKIFTNGYKGARELHSNDIALVELKEDVDITSWTMPVCVDWGLELPDLQHGEKGAVVGFGGERPTKELHFALLPFAKSDECRKNVSDILAVFNKLKDKFCIGFVNRTQVSKGDSGGGIAFPSTDRVWFLRGVVSIGDSARTTYSFFTNVTHYVPWMAGIIQRGEVTGRRCGIGGSQSEGSEIHDFPWDVDVFYKQTSSRHPERLQTGALIRPNLAITQSRTVSSTGQPVDLSEYPAAWLWVTPSRNITSIPNPEMTGNVSEVVRVFFPGDVLAASGRLYNLVLLELRQPLQLMPVCLDWTGTTLLQGQHGTVRADG